MKTKLGLLLLLPGLLLTLSCSKYPPASDRLLEDLAVITQYDTKVDFNDYHTYTLAGTIMKITNKDTVPMTGSTAEAVLAQIDKDMQARGFLKVASTATPDFAIQVIFYENTTVYSYSYYWWGGYYPFYPYYPVYYASYTTGMGNIELVDLKYPDDKQKVAIRWNAYIRGLMTGGHTDAEIVSRVHQAFVQTPQIQTTAN